MARMRSPRSVQRLDTSKFVVLIVLLIIFLLLFVIRGCDGVASRLAGISTPVPTYTFDVAVVRPVIAAPANGARLVAQTATLTGAGAANSQLNLLINGTMVDTLQADRDGRWRYTATFSESGRYDLSVQALDAVGAVLTESRPVQIEVAVPTPTRLLVVAPTPTLVADDFLQVNSLIFQSAAKGSTVLMDGSGLPGVGAQMLANATVVTSTTVGADGLWSLRTQLDNPNQYALGLQAVLTDGQVITVEVPMQALVVAVPTPTAAPTVELTDTTTVATAPVVTPTVTAATLISPTVRPPTVEEFVFARGVNTNTVTLSGTGEADTELRIAIEGANVITPTFVTATVDQTGAWSIVAALDDPGEYQVDVQSVNVDGEVVASAMPFTLVVAAAPVATPTATALPQPTATATSIPPSIGTTETNLTVGDELLLQGTGTAGDVAEIIVGGNLIGTTPITERGVFTYTLTFAGPGVQYIGVRSVKADGRTVMGRTIVYVIVNPAPAATETPTAAPTETATDVPVPTKTATIVPTAPPAATDTNTPTVTMVATIPTAVAISTTLSVTGTITAATAVTTTDLITVSDALTATMITTGTTATTGTATTTLTVMTASITATTPATTPATRYRHL